jgi:putative acetyltransferase
MIRAARPAKMETARVLFREYQQRLGIDLCFQNFEQELASLPGRYTGIWSAEADGEPARIVALRPWADGIGEMKRLCGRPRFQGRGLGKALAETLGAAARQSGSRALRLDTLASMAAAVAIYRSMGFREIEPYTLYPVPGALFLELML